MVSQTGNCNCGAITVKLATTPELAIACHCLNCRRSGGPYSINHVYDENQVTIGDPQCNLKEYVDHNTKSGNPCRRRFCQSCGSPVYSRDVTMPGKLLVKASLFGDIAPARMDVFSEKEIQWSRSS